jgi:hypothetical protein
VSDVATPETPTRGLPFVTQLGAAFERSRVAAGGAIVSASLWSREEGGESSLGYRCVLDDGTGCIDLLFVGRYRVPGLVPGARCRVEGTARMDHGRLTLWNPLYRLGPDRGGSEAPSPDD